MLVEGRRHLGQEERSLLVIAVGIATVPLFVSFPQVPVPTRQCEYRGYMLTKGVGLGQRKPELGNPNLSS